MEGRSAMQFYIILFFIILIGMLLGLYLGVVIFKPRTKKEKFVKSKDRIGKDTASVEKQLITRKKVKAAMKEDKLLRKSIKKEAKEKLKLEKQRLKEKIKKEKIEKKTFADKLNEKENYSSMMEFNCNVDNIDYDAYVKKLRGKQDASYNGFANAAKRR